MQLEKKNYIHNEVSIWRKQLKICTLFFSAAEHLYSYVTLLQHEIKTPQTFITRWS